MNLHKKKKTFRDFQFSALSYTMHIFTKMTRGGMLAVNLHPVRAHIRDNRFRMSSGQRIACTASYQYLFGTSNASYRQRTSVIP